MEVPRITIKQVAKTMKELAKEPEKCKALFRFWFSSEENIDVFSQFIYPEYIKGDVQWFHKEWYKIMNLSTNDAWASFRGSAKSTTLGLVYISWCIVNKKEQYIVYISQSHSKTVQFIEPLRIEFKANKRLRWLYGNLAPSNARDEEGRDREGCVDIGNCRVEGVSFEKNLRGFKYKNMRPTLIICHAKNTKIWENNRLINIQDTKNKKSFTQSKVYKINVRGIPYEEYVTPEHRYLTIEKYRYYGPGSHKNNRSGINKFKNIGWCEAKNLTKNHWIGSKIDYEILPPEPVSKNIGNKIIERDKYGRVKKGSKIIPIYKKVVLDYFNNDDFYYFLGRWMGDGITTKNPVICFNKKDEEGINKIVNFWKSVNKSCSVQETEDTKLVCASDLTLGRWLSSWKEGNSIKIPPVWVRKQTKKRIIQFMKGYIESDGWIDYKKNQIRITSVNYEGLLIVQEMLARIDIPSLIRKGAKPRVEKFKSKKRGERLVKSKQKYDILISHGGNSILGYDIIEPTRYNIYPCFIKGGYLWKKISNVEYVDDDYEIIPIKTNNGIYKTPFGMSHNCDDIDSDERVVNPVLREKDRDKLNKVIIPSMDIDGRFKMIGTILHHDSLLKNQLDLLNGKIYKAIDENNVPLWKERFTLEKLEEIKQQIGSSAFQSEFLNDPSDNESSLIKREWVEQCFINKSVDELEFDELYLGVDFAFSDKVTADNSSFMDVGINYNSNGTPKHLIPLNTEWGHGLSLNQHWQKIKNKYGANNHDMVLLEENSIKGSVDDVRELNIPYKMFWMGARDSQNEFSPSNKSKTISKINAINRLAVMFEYKKIMIPYKTAEEKRMANRLRDELCSWALMDGKLVETSCHPDAPISLILVNEYVRISNGVA